MLYAQARKEAKNEEQTNLEIRKKQFTKTGQTSVLELCRLLGVLSNSDKIPASQKFVTQYPSPDEDCLQFIDNIAVPREEPKTSTKNKNKAKAKSQQSNATTPAAATAATTATTATRKDKKQTKSSKKKKRSAEDEAYKAVKAKFKNKVNYTKPTEFGNNLFVQWTNELFTYWDNVIIQKWLKQRSGAPMSNQQMRELESLAHKKSMISILEANVSEFRQKRNTLMFCTRSFNHYSLGLNQILTRLTDADTMEYLLDKFKKSNKRTTFSPNGASGANGFRDELMHILCKSYKAELTSYLNKYGKFAAGLKLFLDEDYLDTNVSNNTNNANNANVTSTNQNFTSAPSADINIDQSGDEMSSNHGAAPSQSVHSVYSVHSMQSVQNEQSDQNVQSRSNSNIDFFASARMETTASPNPSHRSQHSQQSQQSHFTLDTASVAANSTICSTISYGSEALASTAAAMSGDHSHGYFDLPQLSLTGDAQTPLPPLPHATHGMDAQNSFLMPPMPQFVAPTSFGCGARQSVHNYENAAASGPNMMLSNQFGVPSMPRIEQFEDFQEQKMQQQQQPPQKQKSTSGTQDMQGQENFFDNFGNFNNLGNFNDCNAQFASNAFDLDPMGRDVSQVEFYGNGSCNPCDLTSAMSCNPTHALPPALPLIPSVSTISSMPGMSGASAGGMSGMEMIDDTSQTYGAARGGRHNESLRRFCPLSRDRNQNVDGTDTTSVAFDSSSAVFSVANDGVLFPTTSVASGANDNNIKHNNNNMNANSNLNNLNNLNNNYKSGFESVNGSNGGFMSFSDDFVGMNGNFGNSDKNGMMGGFGSFGASNNNINNINNDNVVNASKGNDIEMFEAMNAVNGVNGVNSMY